MPHTRPKRYMARIGNRIEMYCVVQSNGNCMSLFCVLDHTQAPGDLAADLIDAAKWFRSIANGDIAESQHGCTGLLDIVAAVREPTVKNF